MVIFEPCTSANTCKPFSHDSCICVSFELCISSLPGRSFKHFTAVRVVAEAIEFSEMRLFKTPGVPECVAVRSPFALQNPLVILVLLCY